VAAGEAILNRANIPTFPYPDTAARAFNYMWQYSYNLRGLYETPSIAEESAAWTPDRQLVDRVIQRSRGEGRTILTEFESKQVGNLRRVGNPPAEAIGRPRATSLGGACFSLPKAKASKARPRYTRPMSVLFRCVPAIAIFIALACAAHPEDPHFAVLISANAEWQVVKPLFPGAAIQKSPYGEYFFADVEHERVLFFHGGWGKVAAAGSTQYVIDHFRPARLINLGTCGGVEGRIKRFDVVAVEKVVIYDIAEAMGDSNEAIAEYSTTLPLPTSFPVPVVKATMYSADRDLTAAGLRELDASYQPVVVDWESGAIAWVAHKNGTPLLILRGVTDLVSPVKAEAEGNLQLFQDNTLRVMQTLLSGLPKWLATWR
jgi:adenosylhomocysteine nucleosidase